MAARMILALGLVCLIAGAAAQQTAIPDAATRIAGGNLASGNYLVNGTGVSFKGNKVEFFLNNTSLGKIPVSELTSDDEKDDKEDDTKTHKYVDLNKIGKNKGKKSPPLPAPAPGPGFVEDDVMSVILDKLFEKKAGPKGPDGEDAPDPSKDGPGGRKLRL